jgi:hypothetical protein
MEREAEETLLPAAVNHAARDVEERLREDLPTDQEGDSAGLLDDEEAVIPRRSESMDGLRETTGHFEQREIESRCGGAGRYDVRDLSRGGGRDRDGR